MMGIMHVGEAFALTGVGVFVGLLLAWVYGWTDQRWRTSKRIEKLEAVCLWWARRDVTTHEELNGERARYAALVSELAAEKAKKKCDTMTCAYANAVHARSAAEMWKDLDVLVNRPDPEAERVAKLPTYGTTKKCVACGHKSFFRNMHQYKPTGEAAISCATETLPPEQQYIVAGCRRCGATTQERPLFNKGK